MKKLSDMVKVHAISSVTHEGIRELNQYFTINEPDCKNEKKSGSTTIALLGSSGVGKSTLVNLIAGKEIMKTSLIREKDSKGRHTTTSRELIILENGVTLIDTPGMREIGISEANAGLADLFLQIKQLACSCKFRNCTHTKEPGCAMQKAIAEGELTEDKWNMHAKLSNENDSNSRMKIQIKKNNLKKQMRFESRQY